MKKIITIMLIGIISFSVVGCGKEEAPQNNDNQNNQVTETDAQKFKKEYEAVNPEEGKQGVTMTISDTNPIKYATIDEVFNILENGTGIIYFGFPTCPWCRNILPVLIETASNNQLPIYYYNPQTIRAGGSDKYTHLEQLLGNYWSTDETGQKSFYVPDVYFVKDGKVIGHHLGSVDSQTNPYIVLTDTQKTELTNLYQAFIDQIK